MNKNNPKNLSVRSITQNELRDALSRGACEEGFYEIEGKRITKRALCQALCVSGELTLANHEKHGIDRVTSWKVVNEYLLSLPFEAAARKRAELGLEKRLPRQLSKEALQRRKQRRVERARRLKESQEERFQSKKWRANNDAPYLTTPTTNYPNPY